MQRKSLGKKVLSGLLAFGLCVSMIPAVPMTTLAADEKPVIATTLTGTEWNGTDALRVYVTAPETADNKKGVVDGVDAYTLSGKGSEKYTIAKDGSITLKEGQKAATGDEITITSKTSYYTADQLLWSDGLEKDRSLTPSDGSTYGVVHSALNAHTGLKSATIAETSKDGMWSPDINSTGRLVFWYYDPATEAEMNKDALAARETFRQVKFGMAINGYSNLLLGVGIPDAGDKNATGGTFKERSERLAYVDTYTLRINGNWNRTNISRSEGWHKMEADVTADGTRLFIDGNAVCPNGSSEPFVVTGVTNIEKAAIAANWAHIEEVKEFIKDKHFIDDMYILKADAGEAKKATVSTTVTVDANTGTEPETPVEMTLTFGDDNTGSLAKGETGKVYLDNAEDYAIESVKYTTDNKNVEISEDGTLSLKEGYTPKADETVTVTAEVTYYNQDGVVFTDSFEGEKQFTDGGDNSGLYDHSTAGSLYGRRAATPSSTSKGYPVKDLEEVSDVTVTAWYHDANGDAVQTKFGFSINGKGNALGVFYDDLIAPYVEDMTKTHYGARLEGCTYNNWSWGTTDVKRGTGWHKFQWVIDSEKGLTETIDGKVVSTNKIVGKNETDMELSVKVENYEKIKSLTSLNLLEGWNDNSANFAEINNRYFVDGVTVVKNGTKTETKTLTSVAIPLTDVIYTATPESFEIDTTYPKDQTVYISPYIEGNTDITKVLIDGEELVKEQWSAGKGEAPKNAANYPEEMKGYRVILTADAFKGLIAGEHSVTLVTTAGSEIPVPFTAKTTEHVATDYYLSNNGNDNNDGHTPETAWATFEKLQSVTFGPGDHIYLDATSIWSGVQFRPNGSGAEDNPIILTKYNDGGDSSKRPILNGDGTVANFDTYSYTAFDTWRVFYPSGAIELFNVDQWEVRGIEVTNYAKDMVRGATGRNGIAVIHDYMEVQGITPDQAVKMSDAEKEQAFYRAGKLQHVVIEDCYIHDVVGFHPTNGAVGRGGKMSGGINAYGPYDDLHMDNNIVMYCDVEGIRNDVLAWTGDTMTQFPAYMEDVTVNNNYIVGVPGDGIVLSSAIQPEIANNYLTDAGYSYYATDNKSTASWSNSIAECRQVSVDTGRKAKAMGNRQNPITMGANNFAGLWFIGTKDAVAQYNEAVNNVWVCSDAEAFDADMFCSGTVFQYNYTYRNNGGLLLIMPSADAGTVVRYNVSVEDSQGYGLAGSEGQNGLFHYEKAPDAIYNNLFILGKDLSTVFGGWSNTTHFYNNIMIAPNGLLKKGAHAEDGHNYKNDFHLNGQYGSVAELSGEMYNNLFTKGILDTIVKGSKVKKSGNIEVTVEELDKVFVDLDGFMKAQPVKALLGRSDFKGDKVETLEYGKGAGVAMSAETGRGVQVPTGGFDLTQFAGIKLAENSPAIGAGLKEIPKYDYKAQTDAVYPLTKDFFERDITGLEKVDIGPFQSEGKEMHKHTLELQTGYPASCIEEGRKDCYICEGENGCGKIFWDAEGEEQIADESQIIIPATGHIESDTWMKDSDGHWKECTVCGAVTTEKTVHTDEDGDNFCDVCEYEFEVEHVHKLTKVPAKSATCTENGNKEYYVCDCGKWFSDSEGTKEITDKTSVVVKATGHVDKNKDGKCDYCSKKMNTVTQAPDKTDSDKSQAVKTGDSANLMLWAILVIAAGGGSVGAVLMRRKHSGRRKR